MFEPRKLTTIYLKKGFTIIALAVATVTGAHAQWAAAPPENGIRPIPGHAPMYEAVTRVLVGAGDYVNSPWPPCHSENGFPTPLQQLKSAANLFAAAANMHPALKLAATIAIGPVFEGLDSMTRKSGADIPLILNPDRTASCSPVAVVLPVGSTIEGAHYFAIEGN
jgi:hypothetical protein